MSRLMLTLLTLAAVAGLGGSGSAQTTGVVLMHGNTDSPDGTISLLAAAIKDAGIWLKRPRCAGRIAAGAIGHSWIVWLNWRHRSPD
jgi:hypothetical protein